VNPTNKDSHERTGSVDPASPVIFLGLADGASVQDASTHRLPHAWHARR